jgi:hypothetical protein
MTAAGLCLWAAEATGFAAICTPRGATAAAAAAAVALFFAWLALRALLRRRARRCPWRRDALRAGTRLERWVCADCGVDAFTADGRPPKECKRALRSARL